MKYALGCAFNTFDLFDNFPYKKLKITCKECSKVIGDRHRQILVVRVFLYAYKLVLEDIIERNVTFWFPLNSIRKCNMHMQRVRGLAFKKLRLAGKWSDVDFIKSNFSGYEIGLFMLGQRTPRTKKVYVDKYLKNRITEYTNQGKQYGDGCIDTTVNDYLPLVELKFKGVSKADLKRILVFAWKSLYLHNSYGGDVLLFQGKLWSYIGEIKKSSILHFGYYINKLITKIRVKYRRKKLPWSGYYYFTLSDLKYEEYLQLKKPKGRPRKTFKFKNIMLYEILEECKLRESGNKYIFRTPYIARIKTKFLLRDFLGSIELIETREPLKFKDVLINENKYLFI